MAEFSVFIPLQGIAPMNNWLGGVSLKDRKITWKIKMREMKKIIILGDFRSNMDKMDKDGENKTHKDFTDAVSNYAF